MVGLMAQTRNSRTLMVSGEGREYEVMAQQLYRPDPKEGTLNLLHRKN